MGKISLSNIAEELAARNGLTRDAADNFMHAFIATIEKGLQEDSIVKVKGLGTFKLQEVSDRDSVDINTGERITIKGHRKVTFTPDTAMKELVNRPFAHFEPTELSDGYPTEEETIVSENQTDENDETEISAETTVEETTQNTEEEATVEEAMEAENLEDSAATETAESSEISEEAKTTETADPVEMTKIVEAAEAIEPTEAQEQEAEEPQTTEEATEVAEEPAEEPTTEVKVTEEPKQTPKKHRQYGWLIALLIIAATAGTYYWYSTQLVDIKPSIQEAEEDLSTITVNPNLEEELGSSWGNDSKAQAPQPAKKKEATLPTDKQVAAPTPAKVENTEQKEATASAPAPVKEESAPAPKPAPTASSATGAKFCAVTLTEALAAKDIKDITLADTTEYVMASTLVTHKLRNGETIILLAKKYYGDKRLWPYIVKYNNIKDFNNVAIGQVINIPILQEKGSK